MKNYNILMSLFLSTEHACNFLDFPQNFDKNHNVFYEKTSGEYLHIGSHDLTLIRPQVRLSSI